MGKSSKTSGSRKKKEEEGHPESKQVMCYFNAYSGQNKAIIGVIIA